ncbi:MAG: DUF6511 domain-containing protein [Pseudomonadota bacterium]
MSKLPGYPCPVCGRGGGYASVSIGGQMTEHLCSQKCAEIYVRAKGSIMIKEFEKDAIKEGGNQGAAYLDQLGKTDLSQMTLEEWETFCSLIFTGTTDALQKRADDEIPF